MRPVGAQALEVGFVGCKGPKARGTLMSHQQHQVPPLSWGANEILASLCQDQDLAACLLEVGPRLGDVPLVRFGPGDRFWGRERGPRGIIGIARKRSRLSMTSGPGRGSEKKRRPDSCVISR